MKRFLVYSLVVLMSVACIFQVVPKNALDGADKTAYIEVASGYGISSGSGFFVSEDGNILTAYHVVEDATMIVVETVSHEKFLATVLMSDPNRDCALLDVDGHGYDYFILEDNRTPGLPIYAIGAPFGSDYFPYISQGIISNPSASLAPDYMANLIMIDAATNPGNSGGPIVNKASGNVIGMLVAGDRRGEGLHFVVPSFILMDFLEDCDAGCK